MAVDAALIPSNEEARLAAVRRYDVLDTPPDGAFDRITAVAARQFDVPIAIVSIVDSDRIWFKSHHGVDADEIGRDPGLCASAILQNEPWVVRDAATDPRTLANPLVAEDFGLRFYAGAPLTTGDGFNLGTLCVIDREPRDITERDTETLRDLAAVVMDELELRRSARSAVAREQDLRGQAERTARTLQQSLLPPELLEIPGIDLAAFYHPANDSEVGGDFYDVFPLGDDRWALVVGDVSGKGTEAAAVTALARHTIRTASLSADDPADVLRTLNRAMFLGHGDADLTHYCTAHLIFLRCHDGKFALESASAGHPPALLLRQDADAVDEVPAYGPPVGWHDAPQFESASLTLGSGDVLAVYTDGLTDARRDGRPIGDRPVKSSLLAGRGRDADGITDTLRQLVCDEGVEARDDVAALVVKVR
jgi:phosphoserine phosphatase RsbU/P